MSIQIIQEKVTPVQDPTLRQQIQEIVTKLFAGVKP